MASECYLRQSWLFISEVFWHSSWDSFISNAQGIHPKYELENDWFKITAVSTMGLWFKYIWWSLHIYSIFISFHVLPAVVHCIEKYIDSIGDAEQPSYF